MCYDFEWINLLYVARQLQGAGHQAGHAPDTESKHRTITNRAYYAAYNIAKGYIREVEPLAFTNWGRVTHSEVSGWLQAHSDPDLRDVGRLLKDSFDERWAADYSNRIRDPAESSGKTLILAESIIRALRQRRANENQNAAT